MPKESLSNDLATATSDVIKHVLPDLSNAAGDAATRVVFFPNGIERIYVKLSVGTAVSAELEIAGEKGIKRDGALQASDTSANAEPAMLTRNGLLAPVAGNDRQNIAIAIRDSARITKADRHTSTPIDGATARDNIVDTANGAPARRSAPNPPGGGNPPGGTVELDVAMLRGMLALSTDYTFTVTEIAGGKHSPNSRHYAGVGFDVGIIDGQAVSAAHPRVAAFKQRCRALGATEVLGPGDPDHDTHVHAAWPRLGFLEASPSPEQVWCESPEAK